MRYSDSRDERAAALLACVLAGVLAAGCGQGLKHYAPDDGETEDGEDGADDGLDVHPDDGNPDGSGDPGEEEETAICGCVSNADCDDGVACNGAETCDGCWCLPPAPVLCDDGVDCTLDECTEPAGECQSTPDHERCGEGEWCVPGVGCVTPPDCETDEECDDGYTCDGEEVCDPAEGRCRAGTSVNCKDEFDCTVDVCNEAYDRCDNTADDSRCNDGRFCTIDTCSATEGCLTAERECADAFGCTVDFCDDAASYCIHEPDDTVCEDGLQCTDDVCNPSASPDASGCSFPASTCPDDGLACTDDACFEDGAERCPYPVVEGACLIGGSCYAAGEPSPMNVCFVCDPDFPEEWRFAIFGTRCDDRRPGTVLDHCELGICVGCDIPSRVPACSDGWDNNGNGVADHENDPGCTGALDNSEDGAWIMADCGNSADDDADGRTDFRLDPGCTVPIDNSEGGLTHRACNDGIDNDGDGLTDFPDDIACLSLEGLTEFEMLPIPTSMCEDGNDNDEDGFVDLLDPGCLSSRDNDEFDCGVRPFCADGEDNDGDTLVDFPDDPGCFSLRDDDEANADGVAAECGDGLDNDGDGAVDLADPGCISALDNAEAGS
jgi:hypothetical protein